LPSNGIPVRIGLLIVAVILISRPTFAQEARVDSLVRDSIRLEEEIRKILAADSMLLANDSGALLSLIDSLINAPVTPLGSQLTFRIGYNSNVSSTGRTLGIDEFGLAPGIAYYHKSGLYADVSGYWSQQYTPTYYLTIGTLGYMAVPTKVWSVLAEYNRFQYSSEEDQLNTPYRNSVGVSNFFDVGKLFLRLDYQLFFGDKVGHRVMPAVGFNFEKRNWARLSRIRVFPSVSVLLGSEKVSEEIPYSNDLREVLIRVRNGLPLYYTETSQKYGVMNYAFNFPVSVTLRNWTFMANYSYNIPKQLPGEIFDLNNSGFLSATVFRQLNFLPTRKK
jgi:hypothetical protein